MVVSPKRRTSNGPFKAGYLRFSSSLLLKGCLQMVKIYWRSLSGEARSRCLLSINYDRSKNWKRKKKTWNVKVSFSLRLFRRRLPPTVWSEFIKPIAQGFSLFFGKASFCRWIDSIRVQILNQFYWHLWRWNSLADSRREEQLQLAAQTSFSTKVSKSDSYAI